MSQSISASPSASRDLEAAHARGLAAGRKVQPREFSVVQRAWAMDDTSPVVREWSDPKITLLGWASVVIRPATSPLARAARDFVQTSPGVRGGLQLFMSPFGDCYERNLAYATEFVSALAECGHRDLAVSPRLD